VGDCVNSYSVEVKPLARKELESLPDNTLPYFRLMDGPKPRSYIWLCLITLFLPALPLSAFPANATGHLEVYCDGVGIFLAKIEGAPAPGKLVLFSYMSFPPGTIGGRYLRQGMWINVSVFRNGCVPDGKCESIARGKVLIDPWDMQDYSRQPPPKRISGKYEIDMKGKHLEGSFVLKQYHRKHPLRLCM
jgi:hypothetical protein